MAGCKTAKEMQEQVSDRLEKRLQELEFYDRAETSAYPGMLTMKLYLKDFTPPEDVPDEFYRARKKLSDEKIHLPQGMIGPIVNDEYGDVYFAMYALSARGLPQRKLVLEAEALRQRLSRVGGVEKVIILGEQDPKIYVDISYRRLATLGVKAPDLFRALETQNNMTPSGFVDTAGPRVYLRPDRGINGVEAVKAIPMAGGGKLLKIGDVAEVTRGYEDPATKKIRHQGEPAIILALVMKKGFNGLTLGKSLNAEEAAISKELPLGFVLSKVSDQSHVISEAIDEFMIKFVTALAVVMVVSLAKLGFRVGIVVAAAVPLTLAAVFVIMLLTGRDFDRITLGALILSLGLLVDDAIIAIEMMVVKMEDGDRLMLK
jgi:multidrug efflux pump subunit AcrB